MSDDEHQRVNEAENANETERVGNDEENETVKNGAESETVGGVRESVLFRSMAAWVELTIVGGAGAIAGSFLSGPVQFVVFLATTLVSVVVLFHNVDKLVSDRIERE
ncbi:hypothetical protein [Halorussus ruber]|uniref:hypothetical protein n=1 Tax=Halorussus ruber TaxID=1126238 RepID=UPI00109220E9|nr:hypothetical protein [Halorussus ruber]